MDTTKAKSDLEHLKGKRDVQKALKESKRRRRGFKIVASTSEKISITLYVIALLLLAVLNYIIEIGSVFDFDLVNNFLPQQLQLSASLVEGVMTVVLVLLLSRVARVFFVNGIEDTSTRYNVKRILNLIIGIILFFIILSVLFSNWYTAVVSLGLISLVIGFALQIPITSFIAWIDIVLSAPFKVGDRVKLGEAVGDVVDVSYLEITIWETTGDDLSSSYYTGRVIKIPNSFVLSNPVYNYSWPLFPYMFDDVKFYIGFTSDLSFVEEVTKKTSMEIMGNQLLEEIHLYHELLKETAVNTKELDDEPQVHFRVKDNIWMEVSVRYLVKPKLAGSMKKLMVEGIMGELLKHPDKIIIARGSER